MPLRRGPFLADAWNGWLKPAHSSRLRPRLRLLGWQGDHPSSELGLMLLQSFRHPAKIVSMFAGETFSVLVDLVKNRRFALHFSWSPRISSGVQIAGGSKPTERHALSQAEGRELRHGRATGMADSRASPAAT